MSAHSFHTLLTTAPVTPKGLSRLVAAPSGRVFIWRLMVVGVTMLVLGWFLWKAWLPVLRTAIGALPGSGQIRRGVFEWHGPGAVVLYEQAFLGIAINHSNRSQVGMTADVQVELRPDSIVARSLLGVMQLPYPSDFQLDINPRQLTPWWGAWQPTLLVISSAVLVLAAWIMSSALSAMYALGARLWCLGLSRKVSLAGCWRMAAGAQIPGWLLMDVAVLCYGLGQLPLIGLLVAAILAIISAWPYLILAPLWMPKA